MLSKLKKERNKCHKEFDFLVHEIKFYFFFMIMGLFSDGILVSLKFCNLDIFKNWKTYLQQLICIKLKLFLRFLEVL